MRSIKASWCHRFCSIRSDLVLCKSLSIAGFATWEKTDGSCPRVVSHLQFRRTDHGETLLPKDREATMYRGDDASCCFRRYLYGATCMARKRCSSRSKTPYLQAFLGGDKKYSCLTLSIWLGMGDEDHGTECSQ